MGVTHSAQRHIVYSHGVLTMWQYMYGSLISPVSPLQAEVQPPQPQCPHVNSLNHFYSVNHINSVYHVNSVCHFNSVNSVNIVSSVNSVNDVMSRVSTVSAIYQT